ncbi:L,D-transpeptidase [Candidatus Chlorohelix sp.]|uniref:L,D-transpeptidase n=1 Tax=Candidatus Chlorohelix sp. TaxID=3139201 RepID=UPI0030759703
MSLLAKQYRWLLAFALMLIITNGISTTFAASETGSNTSAPIVNQVKSFVPTIPYANNFSPTPNPDKIYFSDCGHYLSYGFLRFWQMNGKFDSFGCPVTDELTENGRTVQYFQKARMEYHPDLAGTQWETSLGLLGTELYSVASPEERANPAYQPIAALPNGDSRVYFEATKHSLGGGFQQFWNTQGGLYFFGYPISEEYPLLVGDTWVAAQDFERARLLFHPSFGVKLAELGPLAAAARKVSTQASGLDPSVMSVTKDTRIWEHWVDVNLTTFNATFMEGDTPIKTILVVSGKPGHETPVGTFAIFSRIPNEHMKGGDIGTEDYYDLYNVLYTQYFTSEGHALHYAWWRSSFGYQASHGCVNMGLDESFYAWNFLSIGSHVNIHY